MSWTDLLTILALVVWMSILYLLFQSQKQRIAALGTLGWLIGGFVFLSTITLVSCVLGFSTIRVMMVMIPIAAIILAVIYWSKAKDYILVVLPLGTAFFLGFFFYEVTWEFLLAIWNAPSPASWEPVKWALRLIVVAGIALAFLAKANEGWKEKTDGFFGSIAGALYLVLGWGGLAFFIGLVIGLFYRYL